MHRLARFLYGIIFFLIFIQSQQALSQSLEPSFFLNSRMSARAMGVAGAMTAVTGDLSSLNWNPAGLAKINHLQMQMDLDIVTGSETSYDYGIPDRYDSTRWNISSVSAAYRLPETFLVAAFHWEKLSFPGGEYRQLDSLKHSTTSFSEVRTEGTQLNGGEEEWSFALAGTLRNRLHLGIDLTHFAGEQRRIDSLNSHMVGRFLESDYEFATVDREQRLETITNPSGLRVGAGMIWEVNRQLNVAFAYRFPYNRTIRLDTSHFFRSSVNGDQNLPWEGRGVQRAEVSIPAEYSLGATVRPFGSVALHASYTIADWTDADFHMSPYASDKYPSLRSSQGRLKQFRFGGEYEFHDFPLILRSGVLLDNQPVVDDRIEGRLDDPYWIGYSAGAGYAVDSWRLDAAVLHQSGDDNYRLAYIYAGDNPGIKNPGLQDFHWTRLSLSISYHK